MMCDRLIACVIVYACDRLIVGAFVCVCESVSILAVSTTERKESRAE
jgi:hypothetical protein